MWECIAAPLAAGWSKPVTCTATLTSTTTHPGPSNQSCLDPATVAKIVLLRRTLRRCVPVIHAHLLELGVQVSLSSVRRTLRRQGLVKPRSKWARFRPGVPRPPVVRPGDLVQIDTVHFVQPD